MSHVFNIKINPYIGNAEILLDGQVLSSQSQLRICSTDNFFNWYKQLPALLYAEVNDCYSLEVYCKEVQFFLLKRVFQDKRECLRIDFCNVKSGYTVEQRIGWLKDVAQKTGTALPQIPKFSVSGTHKQLVFTTISESYKKYMDNNGSVNIYAVSNETEYSAYKKSGIGIDDIVLIIDESYATPLVIDGNRSVIKTNRNNIKILSEQWIELMILFPYLSYGYNLLTQFKKQLDFICEAKKEMLFRELPVINSKIQTSVECGQTINIDIEEFPQSSLTIRIYDQSILQQKGDKLLGVKAGTTKLDILSDHGEILFTQNINVYFVSRVTDIYLSSPSGQSILLDDTFKIVANWKPVNAQNLNLAVWSCEMNGVLKNIGGGTFKALKQGKCSITLTIEKITKSITVNVMGKPTDIQMPSELKAKVNKTTASFSATLLPRGSACKSMDVRVVDSNIAKWDSIKKQIIPVNEGNTELVVSGYDAKGQIIIQKKCKIEILPEKDVITPPTLPTIMILCLILAIFTFRTALLAWCVISGLSISVIELLTNVKSYIKDKSTQTYKYGILMGTVGTVVFGIFLLWYLGNI